MGHQDIAVPKIHLIGWVQAGDPGAVGTGKVWIDTSLGAGSWKWKVRNVANNAWEELGAGGGGGALYESYCHVRDEKAQNTQSGTFTSGAWRTRDINTEVSDPDAICVIAANQITLAAGTYRCMITTPAWRVDRHQSRLYNTTGAAVVLIGSSDHARNAIPAANHTFIQGRFTIAGAQALEVQHRCQSTHANFGFGAECNFTTEVYTQAEFWKEA